jgi:ribose transport system permease protein
MSNRGKKELHIIEKTINKIINKFGIQTALLLICLVIGLLNPAFFSIQNLSNLLVQASVIAIVAFGMTFVIISGGIDLSVGSVVAFSGIILGLLLKAGIPVIFSILIAISTASVCGLINGLAITKGKIPPFIATLGMMSIARGAGLLLTGGRSISGFDEKFLFIANGKIFKISFPVILLFFCFIICFIILKYTYWGQYIYAIGGNINASLLSGIPVHFYTIVVYLICSLFSGIASLILTARINSAQPVAGTFYELDAIAAVVIGGASLMGGRGSATGTLFGALILAVLKNGLSILNAPSSIQQIAIGLVIIVSVLIDKIRD